MLFRSVSQSRYVCPNETFKIGYNGKTRTAALNTDAFTRIRENIQYYFVPFQSLWKYFEQQVNNMTKGDAGQNISMFASSSTESSKITTSLPYISYIDLAYWLSLMFDHSLYAINDYLKSLPGTSYFPDIVFEDEKEIVFDNNFKIDSIFRSIFINGGKKQKLRKGDILRLYRDW